MRSPESRFRVVIGAATLLMLAISWPLWVGTDDFPRVPFLRLFSDTPRWLAWLVFSTLVATIYLATIGIRTRAMLGLAVLLLIGLILQDQHRFQPWAYQFAMASLALATTSKARALGLARLFVIALYVHSGLSKCDESFSRWMGPSFLDAGLRPFGLDPRAWPDLPREIVVRLMPTIEIAIGLALCLKRTRGLARLGAVAMHLSLIWILGPIGLKQSANVLIWNAALIFEVWFLFDPKSQLILDDPSEETRFAPLVRWIFVMAVLLPFGERAGVFDVWPSFALYASHPERTRVVIVIGDEVKLPASLRAELGWQGDHANQNRTLNLTNWSRRVRGTPIYPQARAANGIAEAIAARYPQAIVSVSQIGRAGSREERTSTELNGLKAIREFGDRSWINAHPAGSTWTGMRNAVMRSETRAD